MTRLIRKMIIFFYEVVFIITVIPTSICSQTHNSDQEQLDKVRKYGQHGLEVGLSYEFELKGQHLGAYLEQFDNSIFQEPLRRFFRKDFFDYSGDKKEFYDLLHKEIIERYPNRENMRLLRQHHPEEFREITKGLNKSEVEAWLNGEVKGIIIPNDKTATPPEFIGKEDSFKSGTILGKDGNPIKRENQIEITSNQLSEIKNSTSKSPIPLIQNDSGIFLPDRKIISSINDSQEQLISKIDIGDEIHKRWMRYLPEKRNALIEFSQLTRQQKGWVFNAFTDYLPSLEYLRPDAPSWMRQTNKPHWDMGNSLEIEDKGYYEDRSTFRKKLREITQTLGVSDYVNRPLDQAFPDYSFHLNISVKDYPPEKLEKFLLYYQDIMLTRFLNSERKQVAAFNADTLVTYKHDLKTRGFVRISDSTKGHFEIRAHTKGPEETMDEVFKYMSEMLTDEKSAIENMKKEVRKLLTPKFFQEMLSSPGLKEKIEKLDNNRDLEKILDSDHLAKTRKNRDLAIILTRYMDFTEDDSGKKILNDLIGNDDIHRKALLEVTQKDNFSLDTFANKYSSYKASANEKLVRKPDLKILQDFAYVFSLSHTQDLKDLYKMVIDKAVELKDIDTLRDFVFDILTQPHTKDMIDLNKLVVKNVIDLAIELKDVETLRDITFDIFSRPYTKDMIDLYKLVIDKAVEFKDIKTIRNFANFVFSQPHTQDMTDLYKLVIDKAVEFKDIETIRDFANYVFSKPHTKDMTDLYKLVIDKAVEFKDIETLSYFAEVVFSKPHTKDMTDLYKLVIEKAVGFKDITTLRYFPKNVFSKPHTKNMTDLYKLVIDKAAELKDVTTLRFFAEDVLSKPHTEKMIDLHKLLLLRAIELEDKITIELMRRNVLSLPHAQGHDFEKLHKIVSDVELSSNETDWKRINETIREELGFSSYQSSSGLAKCLQKFLSP